MIMSSSAMSFASAETALAEGLNAIADGQTDFDLSNMKSVDSAGVAVLLAWQRAANKQGLQLRLLNPPPGLMSLASLYGVSELLSFVPDDI